MCQFCSNCVGFYVLIVKIRKKIVIDMERMRKKPENYPATCVPVDNNMLFMNEKIDLQI